MCERIQFPQAADMERKLVCVRSVEQDPGALAHEHEGKDTRGGRDSRAQEVARESTQEVAPTRGC